MLKTQQKNFPGIIGQKNFMILSKLIRLNFEVRNQSFL